MQTLETTGSQHRVPPQTKVQIHIQPLQLGDDATAFRTLNEEWITRFFTLEKKDIETLGDPENTILRKGGHIFLAYATHNAEDATVETGEAHEANRESAQAVGCVALIPIGNHVYELSKMAVSPGLRGLGIGRSLLQHAIVQARVIGAGSLFLGSSTKLQNAIHLYESVGFQHVPPEQLPPMPYARADVFMQLPLA